MGVVATAAGGSSGGNVKPEDLLPGKVAYVNGQRIEGNAPPRAFMGCCSWWDPSENAMWGGTFSATDSGRSHVGRQWNDGGADEICTSQTIDFDGVCKAVNAMNLGFRLYKNGSSVSNTNEFTVAKGDTLAIYTDLSGACSCIVYRIR